MKKIFAGTPHTKVIAAASALTWTIAMANSAGAAQLQEARVTQVVNDVKLLLEQSAPRPATISDLIRHGTAVRTGTQSRSELTFADLTITRLGANTIFSFKEGTREMNLIDGAILFQVPKGSGGATIRTVGVTAAITGTTGIGEFHPATTSHPKPSSKWLCLEGTFHLYLPNGQSLELGPGKMVTTDGKSFSKVMTFDIAKLVSTSLFFTGYDQPLASMNLIMLESENQLASSLFATSTTNPLDPARIVNVTSQAIVAEETQTSPSASPTPPITPTPPVSPTPPPPTPSKFGTPSVISSPVPYLITNGTVITTDPSITTNGVTDYGKVYRGQTNDGAFSLWAFGSTSAFDTAVRIDDIFFADPSHLPIAVFKFESLSLTGDPTIDTSNGVTKLALIGVDGITSGPPGGTLKFTGLDLLLLATVNGSINLTSDVSFQDLHELAMYARGAGSDLTINSPISNIGILGLVAEDSLHLTNPGTMSVGKLDAITGGDLMLQIGGSLLLNGRVRLDAIVLPGANVASGINLTLHVTGDYTNSSATESSRLAITNRDRIGGDAAIAVGATNISTANDFDVQIVNQGGGRIGENALINVGASNDINVVGDAMFQILNDDGGQIGGNGNISVTTGGDFTANSILGFVNNRNGGAITSGANIVFDIGGTLTTQGDAVFGISTRNDGAGGGTVGSLATVDLSAASVSVGGFFQTFVATNGGGAIQGDATNRVAISGDLTAQQGILVTIEDTIFGGTGNFTGGHIGGNAIVTLGGQNIITPSTNSGTPGTDLMAIEASIYPNTGGTVGGDAIVDVSASQNISAPGSVLFWVANGNYQNLGPGMIGGNAEVNVSASNISTGDFFDQILNYGGASIGGHAAINLTANTLSVGGNLDSRIDNFSGGTIGGNASINVATGGDINAQGNAVFSIANSNFNSGSGAGAIVGNATVNVSATSITAGALFETIVNLGSSIGGNGAIGVLAPSGIISGGDIAFSIYNAEPNGSGEPAGTIGSDATIHVSAGDISIAGSLENAIYNKFTGSPAAGSIGGNAMLSFDAGAITVHDGASFKIDSNDGGEIGGNATINLSATSLSVDGTLGLLEHIINFGGGNIGGSADLSFNLTGDLTTQAEAKFQVVNNNDGSGGGTIGGDATINVRAQNITANTLSGFMLNDGGGNVGGDANLNFTLTGDLTTQGDANFFFNNNNGGTIGGNAALSISAANINANSLVAQIDNTGGIIGGNTEGGAMINMNVSNSATVTNDATVAIYGSDGAVGGAGININGGNYNVGGTFLSYIDGNGTITFNNASAHADVLKAGVFGANGVLNIGGGTLSADSTLKLYAPGSNGQLNFISNVTLGGNSVKILAANSITIFNNVVVTISGSKPADVYTGFTNETPNANYTGFGGNGSTTGTFGGAGANDPQPIENAPPFDSTNHVTSSGKPRGGGKATDTTINVSNSDELLALLNDLHPGRDGRIRIPDSKRASHGTNASRFNAAADVNAHRRAMDMDRRTASIPATRRLPQ